MFDQPDDNLTCLAVLQRLVSDLCEKVHDLEAHTHDLENEEREIFDRLNDLKAKQEDWRSLDERLQLGQRSEVFDVDRLDLYRQRKRAVAEYQIALSALQHAVERAREMNLPVPEIYEVARQQVE